jgi:5-methyltetrahydrofolate--homocysteine methyltransferase
MKLVEQMERVKDICRAGSMRVRAVWQWFAAESDGNEVALFAAEDDREAVGRWTFPRQPGDDGLCLADYVLPPRDGRRDHVALLVTTAGTGILERAAEAKEAGEYVLSHGLQALALETAEGAAEWLHQKLRAAWGFPDPPDLTRKQIFQARYQGKRYSFGYPACPDLAGQQLLFELLDPTRIGVSLTEGYMMEPEASVSALVFHHPDARYFAVKDALTQSPA